MTRLSVNLNKIALLRNARTLGIPSVARAAGIALDAGAQGITVHPRPDGRHIRVDDVQELAGLLKGRPGGEFNIEGNPFHALLEIVGAVRRQFTRNLNALRGASRRRLSPKTASSARN